MPLQLDPFDPIVNVHWASGYLVLLWRLKLQTDGDPGGPPISCGPPGNKLLIEGPFNAIISNSYLSSLDFVPEDEPILAWVIQKNGDVLREPPPEEIIATQPDVSGGSFSWVPFTTVTAYPTPESGENNGDNTGIVLPRGGPNTFFTGPSTFDVSQQPFAVPGEDCWSAPDLEGVEQPGTLGALVSDPTTGVPPALTAGTPVVDASGVTATFDEQQWEFVGQWLTVGLTNVGVYIALKRASA